MIHLVANFSGRSTEDGNDFLVANEKPEHNFSDFSGSYGFWSTLKPLVFLVGDTENP